MISRTCDVYGPMSLTRPACWPAGRSTTLEPTRKSPPAIRIIGHAAVRRPVRLGPGQRPRGDPGPGPPRSPAGAAATGPARADRHPRRRRRLGAAGALGSVLSERRFYWPVIAVFIDHSRSGTSPARHTSTSRHCATTTALGCSYLLTSTRTPALRHQPDPTAQIIRRFRALDMPLEEIHAVMTPRTWPLATSSSPATSDASRSPWPAPRMRPHHCVSSSSRRSTRHQSPSSIAGCWPHLPQQ
jgi:hypothetical protein